MVFDTGVLVEIVKGTDPAIDMKRRIKDGELSPHITDLNLFELSYIICRRQGWQRASSVVESVRQSGYFYIHEAQEFLKPAARLKCERALSIVDCLTLAAGEALSIPVLFAGHERELDSAIAKSPFKAELRFLSEPE
jgi:uncharacterized protein